MDVELVEYASNAGRSIKVDREKCIVPNVKIMGNESANGRTYLSESLRDAIPLFEGARVGIDHPKSLTDPITYAGQLGDVKNVRQQADGLYGDIHYNPKHALAEGFLWDAENRPDRLGMSPVSFGETANRSGREVVTKIKRVRGIDVVPNPATTKGLFESKDDQMEVKQLQEQIDALKADVLKLNGEKTALQEQLDTAKSTAAENDRKTAINAAFAEHKVDKTKVPAGILALIESQPAETAKTAIKELAESLKSPTVKSGPNANPHSGKTNDGADAAKDGKSFAESIRA